MTRCELFAACGSMLRSAAGSLCNLRSRLHTSFSDWAASSAVSVAARLTCCTLCTSHARCPPCPSSSVSLLGTSVVTDYFRPRVSVDHEHLCVLHDAGVYQYNFTCLDVAEALVDKPFVNSQLHDFGLVREGLVEASFPLLVLQLGVFSFHALQPSDCHVRLEIDLPFSARKENDHPTDRAALVPIPGRTWPGGVSHRPQCLAPLGPNHVLGLACRSRQSLACIPPLRRDIWPSPVLLWVLAPPRHWKPCSSSSRSSFLFSSLRSIRLYFRSLASSLLLRHWRQCSHRGSRVRGTIERMARLGPANARGPEHQRSDLVGFGPDPVRLPSFFLRMVNLPTRRRS